MKDKNYLDSDTKAINIAYTMNVHGGDKSYRMIAVEMLFEFTVDGLVVPSTF